MSHIRYLLDENVSSVYRTELVKRETTLIVWKVGDPGVPAKGTSDPDILCWCEEHGFLLVTNNRKSMPDHVAHHMQQGRYFPGIIELNPKMSVGETIDELLLIRGCSDMNEYQNKIVYLPIN